ncbi:MAG: hypothetical protein KBD01_17545, partial [Acidobacteria bacterium]|nr:hypothetical protein [Acidobacteriota bacterium]
ALIMIGLSIYHAAWLIWTARGRRELIEMLPDPLHDLKDLKGSFAWFVGARPAMPPARRYTYREKMEYWALVWGTLVMVVSGVILWTAPHWPSLAVRLSSVVHGYEALLALLAILVWHMLGVHFKPGIFPMNPTWLRGSLGLHAMKEEHRAEYEQLVAWHGFDPEKENGPAGGGEGERRA